MLLADYALCPFVSLAIAAEDGAGWMKVGRRDWPRWNFANTHPPCILIRLRSEICGRGACYWTPALVIGAVVDGVDGVDSVEGCRSLGFTADDANTVGEGESAHTE